MDNFYIEAKKEQTRNYLQYIKNAQHHMGFAPYNQPHDNLSFFPVAY